MSPISKEEKITKEMAEEFKETFTTLFSNDLLKEIYKKEKKEYDDNIDMKNEKILIEHNKEKSKSDKVRLVSTFDEQTISVLKKIDQDEDDYIPLIKNTILYIKENIFHSSSGEYYVLSYSKKSGFYPKEISKENIASVYTKYFPTIVKSWFDRIYSKVFDVIIEQNKPRIYSEKGLNFLNLFNGYPDDNIARDEDLMKTHKKNIELYLNHIKKVLCGNNNLVYNEFVNWLYALIGGRRKLNTCLYLKGAMGVGKGMVAELITRILGEQNCVRIQKASQILGDFNGHLAGKLFVYIDDVPLKDGEFRSLYEALKAIITESTNTYRDLFKRAVTLTNLNSVMITTNHDLLKLDGHNSGRDRRLVMCDINNEVKDASYFAPFWALNADENFRRCFLWHCQDNYDPEWNEQINIKKLPLTNTANQMILHSIPPIVDYLKSIIDQENFSGQRIPKDEYKSFCDWYLENPTLDKKRLPKYHSFISDLSKFNFTTIKNERYKGENKSDYPDNPTIYLTMNRDVLITEFKGKGFFSKFDLIDGQEITPLTKKEKIKLDMIKLEELSNEYRRLKKSILEALDNIDDEAPMKKFNDGSDAAKFKKRILPTSEPTVLSKVDSTIFSMSFD